MADTIGSVHRPPEGGPTVAHRAVAYTDIEGSTQLWERRTDAMAAALELHHHTLHQAVAAVGGRVVKDLGDGLLLVFPDSEKAVTALIDAQSSLATIDWDLGDDQVRVRMAIDTGTIEDRGDDVSGPPLNRASRMLDIARGGQILVSDEVVNEIPETIPLVDLGAFPLKGIAEPVGVHRVVLPEQIGTAPPAGIGWAVRGFELQERIGSGASGAVYRAVQRSVGREVAVKLIRPEYANDRRFVQRFEAEAQFVAQLEHPQIVSLHDFWRDPDGAYLVMPFLRGGSLRQALTGDPWPERKATRLLFQVGSALAHAHRRGVLHLDVRPANVLLDEDGNAYLSDFGIASRPIMTTGRLPSTSPGHRSPEELRDEPLTEHTDQYCLGLLALELFSGKRPPYLLPEQSFGQLPPRLVEPLLRAIALNPADRYPSVEAFLAALGPVDMALAPTEVTRNPFKGLRPFLETDAADFAGRDELIDRMLTTVEARPLTAVVGASGSGKSSAVRAGLIPRLRTGAIPGSENWLIASMYPGTHPFATLAEALRGLATHPVGDLADRMWNEPTAAARVIEEIIPPDTTVVLVVDQFEELFTLVHTESERRRFVTALCHFAKDRRARTKLVLTLRADFMDRPLRYSELAPLLQEGLVTVGSPSAEELTQCITEPSIDAGLVADDALVDLIVGQVVDEPGGLPLLEYTLTELFHRRDGNRLTAEAFHEIGGVGGALGSRAEELFERLEPPARDVAESLFLRFVSVADDGTVTRRRVLRRNLEGVDSEALEAILGSYGEHRLLTFDRDPTTRDPTVELAHEALLTEWPRLADWIEERRSDLITERHLATAVAEWDTAGRDPEHLVAGGRLAHFESWATETDLALTALERVYLREAQSQQTQRTARRRRIRNWVTAAFAVIAVIASVAAIVAIDQGRAAEERSRSLADANRTSQRNEWDEQLVALRAEKAQERAEANAREAQARELAAAATANLDEDPELSILLAVAAIEETADDGLVVREAEEALHEALVVNRLFWSADGLPPWMASLDSLPDGRLVVSGYGQGLVIDPAGVTPDHSLPATWRRVSVSPDGSLYAVSRPRGLEYREWMDSTLSDEYLSPDEFARSPVVPGTQLQILEAPWTIEIRDVRTHELVSELVGHWGEIQDFEFTPDGSRLASLANDGTARVWDLDSRTGTIVLRHFCTSSPCIESDLDLSNDGRFLGVASLYFTPQIYDLQAGEAVEVDYPVEAAPSSIAFLSDGIHFAVGLFGTGSVHVFEIGSGVEVDRARDMEGTITSLVLSPDGNTLAAASLGTGAILYEFDGIGLQRVATLPSAGASLAFDAAGEMLASADADEGGTRIAIFDQTMPGGGELASVPTFPDFPPGVAISPDGRHVAAGHVDGGVAIWNAASGDLVAHLPNPVEGGAPLVVALEFSPDGSQLVAGGTSYGLPPEAAERYGLDAWTNASWVRVWDVESTSILFDPMQPTASVYISEVTYSRDGQRLVSVTSGSSDADTLVLDTATWETAFRLGDHATADRVASAGLSPDGDLLAIQRFGIGDNVEIWDIRSRTMVETLSHAPSFLGTAQFDDDGTRVLTVGSSPPTIWDTTAGTARIVDGDVEIRRARWSPPLAIDRFELEGPLIGGAAQDGTVRIWDGTNGEELLTLRGHTGEVWDIEFDAAGMRLATVDSNGAVRVWTLDIEELLQIARDRVTRTFTSDECRTYLHLDACPAD